MTFTTTVVFYLLIGTGVAVAIALCDGGLSRGERVFRIATAVFFWPFFVPLLLQERASVTRVERNTGATASPRDALANAIDQVEFELDAAIGSLEGWAEGVLATEDQRLAELKGSWRAQAQRIRELDRLLAQPDFAEHDIAPPLEPSASTSTVSGETAAAAAKACGLAASRGRSERARVENLRRLGQLRQRMLDDLLGTLAWVRELVTMIHLARFSGAPASRAQELVGQIAAAVEGLNEVSRWGDEESSSDSHPEGFLPVLAGHSID